MLLDTTVINRMFKNKGNFYLYRNLENGATKIRRYQIVLDIDQ